MRNFALMSALTIAGASLLSGCASAPAEGVPVVPWTPRTDRAQVGADVNAGVPVPAMQDPERLKAVVTAMRFPNRRDPFALLPAERSFEAQQGVERLLSQGAGFGVFYDLPEEVAVQEEPFEEQPYRRLAGILVGDSVLAIIDMGDGRAPRIIRPGQMIPDSEWRVVSIDQDRAVLRRATGRPREVTVRLESPRDGGQAPGGGPAAPGGQEQPGGFGEPGRGPAPAGVAGPGGRPPRGGID